MLIGCIPLGLEAVCAPGTFFVRGRVWFIPFRVGKKAEKEAGTAEGKAYSALRRRFSDWNALKIILENGYTILCRLVSRIRVKLLKLHFTAAGSDPAAAAMVYSAAGIAMESLSCICAERVACAEFRVDVDFEGCRPQLSGRISMTMRLYQALDAVLRFGWGVLRDHHRLRKGRIKTYDKSSAGRYDGNRHG